MYKIKNKQKGIKEIFIFGLIVSDINLIVVSEKIITVNPIKKVVILSLL